MSTNRPICARQYKSNQNGQILHRLEINKICYFYFVSSYQDKNNEMIAFSEKSVYVPQPAKMFRKACGQLKSNQNRQILHRLAINKVCYSYFVSTCQDKNRKNVHQLDKMSRKATSTPDILTNT